MEKLIEEDSEIYMVGNEEVKVVKRPSRIDREYIKKLAEMLHNS